MKIFIAIISFVFSISAYATFHPAIETNQLKIPYDSSVAITDITTDTSLTGETSTDTQLLTAKAILDTIEDGELTLINKSMNGDYNTFTNVPMSALDALTPNYSVATNDVGQLIIGPVTFTELSYLSGATGNLQGQINSINSQISGINSQISTLNGQVSTLQGQVSTINGQISSINGQISSINSQISAINSQIGTLQGQVSTINGQISTLQGQVSTLQGQVSDLESEILTKQDIITGAASTVTDTDLTPSRVLISNSLGKIDVSASVDTVELEYLDGVTSSIQNQINAKAPIDAPTFTTSIGLTSGDVTLSNGLVKFGADGKGFCTTTSDGSDNYRVRISGGGGFGYLRGASLDFYGNESAGVGQLEFYAGNVSGGQISFYTQGPNKRLQIDYNGDLTIGDASNFIFNTSTGTKLGEAANQKLGFWGATPVVQPSGTGETVGFTAGSGTAVLDDSTFTGNIGSTAYRINDIVKALKQTGILAQ